MNSYSSRRVAVASFPINRRVGSGPCLLLFQGRPWYRSGPPRRELHQSRLNRFKILLRSRQTSATSGGPAPEGGYRESDVPDRAVWGMIRDFDQAYTSLLAQLQACWSGDPDLDPAIDAISNLTDLAVPLVKTPRPDGSGRHYGPCFRRA